MIAGCSIMITPRVEEEVAVLGGVTRMKIELATGHFDCMAGAGRG